MPEQYRIDKNNSSGSRAGYLFRCVSGAKRRLTMDRREAVEYAIRGLLLADRLNIDPELPEELLPEIKGIIDNNLWALYYLCNESWKLVELKLRKVGVDPSKYL